MHHLCYVYLFLILLYHRLKRYRVQVRVHFHDWQNQSSVVQKQVWHRFCKVCQRQFSMPNFSTKSFLNSTAFSETMAKLRSSRKDPTFKLFMPVQLYAKVQRDSGSQLRCMSYFSLAVLSWFQVAERGRHSRVGFVKRLRDFCFPHNTPTQALSA